jgi:hypothetical protein
MIRFLGKWTPTLVGLLLVYSGIYKLFRPGEATMALIVLGFNHGLAGAAIVGVTILELYPGTILLLKLDVWYGLWLATGLMLAFTLFLWYLSLLAHPPACGCMGLTHTFVSNRHNALAGMARNVLVLWLLKCGFDYYAEVPTAKPSGLP